MRTVEKARDPVTNVAVDEARARLQSARLAREAAKREADALHRQVVAEGDPLQQRRLGKRLNAVRDAADEAETAERDAAQALAQATQAMRGQALTHSAPERRALIRALDEALREVEQRNRALVEFDRRASAAIGTDVTPMWGAVAFGAGPWPEMGQPDSAIAGWRRTLEANGWL